MHQCNIKNTHTKTQNRGRDRPQRGSGARLQHVIGGRCARIPHPRTAYKSGRGLRSLSRQGRVSDAHAHTHSRSYPPARRAPPRPSPPLKDRRGVSVSGYARVVRSRLARKRCIFEFFIFFLSLGFIFWGFGKSVVFFGE